MLFFFEVTLVAQQTHRKRSSMCTGGGLAFSVGKKYVRQVMKGKPKIITNTALLTPWGPLLLPDSIDSILGNRVRESGSSSKCSEQLIHVLLL